MTTSISQNIPVQEVTVQRKSGEVKKGDAFQEVLKKTLKTKEEAPKEEEEKKDSLPADPLHQEPLPMTSRMPEAPEESTLALSAMTDNKGLLVEIKGLPVDASVDIPEIPVEQKPEENTVPFKLQADRKEELRGSALRIQEEGDGRLIEVPKDQRNLPREDLQAAEKMIPKEFLSQKELLNKGTVEEAFETKGLLKDMKALEPSKLKKDEDLSLKDSLSEPVEEPEALSGKKTEAIQPVSPEVFQKLSVKEEERSEPMKAGPEINLSEKTTEVPAEIRSQETLKTEGNTETSVRIPFEENLELATTKILERMETISEGGRTTMKMKLHPEEMGEMEITLTLEEGKLSGKILLENHEMRQLFARRIDELSENLKASSVNVLKFEVGVGDKEAGNQARQQGNPFRPSMNPFNGFKGYLKEEHEANSQGNKSLSGLEGVNLLA